MTAEHDPLAPDGTAFLAVAEVPRDRGALLLEEARASGGHREKEPQPTPVARIQPGALFPIAQRRSGDAGQPFHRAVPVSRSRLLIREAGGDDRVVPVRSAVLAQ